MSTPRDVLDFWLGEPTLDPEAFKQKLRRWYQGGSELDGEVVARFRDDVERAVRGELDDWARDPRGRLALIVLLDQFTRNVYRDDRRTYAGDARAQRLAVEAYDRGLDRELSIEERQFLQMPLVHAEDVALQERGMAAARQLAADAPAGLAPLFAMGVEQTTKYHGIIGRFGRFPHRNALLGRTSTPEELEFLKGWAERQPPAAMRPATG